MTGMGTTWSQSLVKVMMNDCEGLPHLQTSSGLIRHQGSSSHDLENGDSDLLSHIYASDGGTYQSSSSTTYGHQFTRPSAR